MTRAIYFDCFAGASGDMIVGSLLDLGLDFDLLREQLGRLRLPGYEVRKSRVSRSGLQATKFDVEMEALQPPNRGLRDIGNLIEASSIAERAKSTALAVFRRLADAEARVHGTTVEEVHFHEVGAVDSIVDITAAAISLDMLGIDRFFASALRVGYGTIRAAHGVLPIPGPATADLLRGAPVYAGEIEGEFVTPTGAAILSTLCSSGSNSFGPMPRIAMNRIGYGAGTRDPHGLPNVVRAIIGDLDDTPSRAEDGPVTALPPEEILVIETNIDDMSPQVYSYVFDRAFEMGALDVFVTPIQMKKDRPAAKLTILAPPAMAGVLTDLLLTETTTLGVRYYEAARRVLARETTTVDTEYGPVSVKVARLGSRTLHFRPEYEDCVRIARHRGVPLIEVQDAACAAYRSLNTKTEPED
ncbi:MAG TPA: nickel pincer cofactor biosynthesis protein LarC [Blastocatellia bacterium]|nr:nickel pincer cofactor biosynthesis protein LarC [Blastocatellia bacterium]